ncbi:MAG TPA: maleylacetoacetate isomerase [Rhodanobacteraceae bacterium]|nr:maleylacetoacetate isomerase [Rhodanobacteraceae bacterium]
MTANRTLYNYWRSSASYRVRIALNLKGLDYTTQSVHLVRAGGEQHRADYRKLNPLALVPTLVDGAQVLTQSLAIMEYLDDAYPETPPLLPTAAPERARARAIAQAIACDIHPIGDLRILQYLAREFAVDDAGRSAWSRHWIEVGFAAIETMLAAGAGDFCVGAAPSLADCCLVPQVYNARRHGVALDAYPAIVRIDAACRRLDAFARAVPEVQPDAPRAPG